MILIIMPLQSRNMWEKSVANDDNEEENDECDADRPADKPAESAFGHNHASPERLPANLYGSQELYPHSALKLAKSSNTHSKNSVDVCDEKDAKSANQCSRFYCTQNGFFNQNANYGDRHDIQLQCNADHRQANISLIKPSNTYPIIKDLNKLRSMSLPSMF